MDESQIIELQRSKKVLLL